MSGKALAAGFDEATVVRKYRWLAPFRSQQSEATGKNGAAREPASGRDYRLAAILCKCAPAVATRAAETAPVYIGLNEPLKLRVFIDKSVVEVFVNGKQYVAVRVYPTRADSLGVSIVARGQNAGLNKLTAWQMNPI